MADDEQKNIKLVLEVEKYPCLYNTTLSSYSRKTETDKAWAEIGKKLKMTGAVCKEKWRNLRVVYMRHLKPLPSGSGRNKKKPYYLLDHMHFLTPCIKPMNPPEAGNLASISLGNTLDVSNDLPDDVPTEPEQPTESCDIEPSPSSTQDNIDNPTQHSSNPKRKKSSLHDTDQHFINYLKHKSNKLTTSQTSTDSVMSFLNSLAPELREMNLQQFKMFKRRVLSLVDDILNPPSTPERPTTGQFITLSNETSHQIVYSPILQYTEYGSPYVQPAPTPNPLDFSGISTGTLSNSIQPVQTSNPQDFSGMSNSTEYTPMNQDVDF